MHCINTKHAVLGETGDRTGIKEGTMQIILLYPIKILILKKKIHFGICPFRHNFINLHAIGKKWQTLGTNFIVISLSEDSLWGMLGKRQ